MNHLKNPEIQAAIVKAVEEQRQPDQLELEGVTEKPDIAAVVAKTVEQVTQQTINIPRISGGAEGRSEVGLQTVHAVVPGAGVSGRLRRAVDSAPRGHQLEVVGVEPWRHRGRRRLEDYVSGSLVDFDDISYDDHADLLYDLAAQTVQHFQSYLSEDDTRKVLRCYQRDIARFIHAQMQAHYWEDVAGYEVKISKGYTELRKRLYAFRSRADP